MVTLILTLLHFRMHIIFNSSLGTHTVEVDIHDTIDNVKNKLKVILGHFTVNVYVIVAATVKIIYLIISKHLYLESNIQILQIYRPK